MTSAASHVKVFIGSSTEGLRIARPLQSELEAATGCTVDRWDIRTFAPGSFTLEALIEKASLVDFAILVATGEDTVTSRGTQTPAVRDNIIFEFGLFLGALGRERVYLLSVGDAKLPSDLLGLTRLTFRERQDGDVRAGLNDAVLRVEEAISKLGPRPFGTTTEKVVGVGPGSVLANVAHEALAEFPGATAQAPTGGTGVQGKGMSGSSWGHSTSIQSLENSGKALEEEVNWLCDNAIAQGWSVKNNPTRLRLTSPKGKEFALPRRRPADTRTDLRKFVAELRANGLRVNRALQGPVEHSPFG